MLFSDNLFQIVLQRVYTILGKLMNVKCSNDSGLVQNLKIIRRCNLKMLVIVLLNINPIVPNAPFLYSPKISENLTVENECIGNEWINSLRSKFENPLINGYSSTYWLDRDSLGGGMLFVREAIPE